MTSYTTLVARAVEAQESAAKAQDIPAQAQDIQFRGWWMGGK